MLYEYERLPATLLVKDGRALADWLSDSVE